MSTVAVWASGCFLAGSVTVVEGASAGPGPSVHTRRPSGVWRAPSSRDHLAISALLVLWASSVDPLRAETPNAPQSTGPQVRPVGGERPSRRRSTPQSRRAHGERPTGTGPRD